MTSKTSNVRDEGDGHRRKEDLRDVRQMPAQKPGKSKQDYMTPDAFMSAIETRFGRPTLDLAATRENTRCDRWISPEQDSFLFDWSKLAHGDGCDLTLCASLSRVNEQSPLEPHELAFLNPPFGLIDPWARKCAQTEKLGILFLVPASVGSNWWLKYVHKPSVDGQCSIHLLQPRIPFDGQLCVFKSSKDGPMCGTPIFGDKCPKCGHGKLGYPKDCALIYYNDPEVPQRLDVVPRYYVWNWEKDTIT